MGIGLRELIVLLLLFAVAWLFMASIIWFAKRRSKDSAVSERHRSVSDRLAELGSLRRAGRISDDKHERRRASIIASV